MQHQLDLGNGSYNCFLNRRSLCTEGRAFCLVFTKAPSSPMLAQALRAWEDCLGIPAKKQLRNANHVHLTNADKTQSSCAGAGTSPKSQVNHLPVSIVRLQQCMTTSNARRLAGCSQLQKKTTCTPQEWF